ncbi:hypothetical protein DRP05_04025 [Archaeoglobales archaeon]|nr:MAG: hypothetical protein DRP05_04025 [Archaeoglobales archaeon]
MSEKIVNTDIKVRKAEKEDLNDILRILSSSFEREIEKIFGDAHEGREILKRALESLNELKGIYVAESSKILGCVGILAKEIDNKIPIGREAVKSLGFTKGTRAKLLLSFFKEKPKKNDVCIDYLAVSKFYRNMGVGSALYSKVEELARLNNKNRIRVWVSVENDEAIDFFMKRSFNIAKMLDSKYAEKYFGQRYWYLLEKLL